MDPQSRPEAADTAADAATETLAERLASAELRLAVAMSLSAVKQDKRDVLADVWDGLPDEDRLRAFAWVTAELAARCSTAQVRQTLDSAMLEAHIAMPDANESALIDVARLETEITDRRAS
ncbi:hypothetical protein [Rhodococcus pyridinivorans]|uniref:Uncharacterized protein n=1 Tax=Rhodococcus pyridinivorans AK37 TaxID=1114960 RepID=H0JNC9_9NOCA|nr:hypothetical protein [Rhodococcus pyridinivorans]EHK84901.1 hypothetical protein AK37_05562 [Rhodococcus pyridinivorans AK37]MCD2142278.1 hypothetical protein [Rhodococcus pyridinivorans]